MSASTDGGRTWRKAVTVTPSMNESWLVPTQDGNMLADCLSVVFVQGRAFGTCAVAKEPDAATATFDEAIYATPLPYEYSGRALPLVQA